MNYLRELNGYPGVTCAGLKFVSPINHFFPTPTLDIELAAEANPEDDGLRRAIAKVLARLPGKIDVRIVSHAEKREPTMRSLPQS